MARLRSNNPLNLVTGDAYKSNTVGARAGSVDLVRRGRLAAASAGQGYPFYVQTPMEADPEGPLLNHSSHDFRLYTPEVQQDRVDSVMSKYMKRTLPLKDWGTVPSSAEIYGPHRDALRIGELAGVEGSTRRGWRIWPERGPILGSNAAIDLSAIEKEFPELGLIRSAQLRLSKTAGKEGIQEYEANRSLYTLLGHLRRGEGDIANHVRTFNLFVQRLNETSGTNYALLPVGAEYKDLMNAMDKNELKLYANPHAQSSWSVYDKLQSEQRTLLEQFSDHLRKTPVRHNIWNYVNLNNKELLNASLNGKTPATSSRLFHSKIQDASMALDFEDRYRTEDHILSIFKAGPGQESNFFAFLNKFFPNDYAYAVKKKTGFWADGRNTLVEQEPGANIKEIIKDRLLQRGQKWRLKEGYNGGIFAQLRGKTFADNPLLSDQEIDSMLGKRIYSIGTGNPYLIDKRIKDGQVLIKPAYHNFEGLTFNWDESNASLFFNRYVEDPAKELLSKGISLPSGYRTFVATSVDEIKAKGKISQKTRDLVDKLIGSNEIQGVSIKFAKDDYKFIGTGIMPAVKELLYGNLYYSRILGDNHSAVHTSEDLVQDLHVSIIDFAREWIKENKIQNVTEDIKKDFTKTWRLWAPTHVRVKDYNPEKGDIYSEAFNVLQFIAPEAKDATDIHRIVSHVDRLKPLEREVIAPLLRVGSDPVGAEELAKMLYVGNPTSLDKAVYFHEDGTAVTLGDVIRDTRLGPEEKENIDESWRLSYDEHFTPEGWDKLNALRINRNRLNGIISRRRLSLASDRHSLSVSRMSQYFREKPNYAKKLFRVKTQNAELVTLMRVRGGMTAELIKHDEIMRSTFPTKLIGTILEQYNKMYEITNAVMHGFPGVKVAFEGQTIVPHDIRGETLVWKNLENGKHFYFNKDNLSFRYNAGDLARNFNTPQGLVSGRLWPNGLPFLRNPEGPYSYNTGRLTSVHRNMDLLGNMQEGQKILMLDIETTTLRDLAEKQKHSELFGITQIAAQEHVFKGGRLVPHGKAFDVRIKPSERIRQFLAGNENLGTFGEDIRRSVENVGGLEQLSMGISEDTAIKRFQRLVNKHTLIGGHNIPFDIGELEKAGVVFPEGQSILNTMAVAIGLNEPSVAQERLAKKYLGEGIQAHEGSGDIRQNVDILNKWIQQGQVKHYLEKPRLTPGDYLLQFRGRRLAEIDPANSRGVFQVKNYGVYGDVHVLDLLRVDTGKNVQLRFDNAADLEHAMATRFAHIEPGQVDYLTERYVGDRTARMARKMTSTLGGAKYYEQRMDAIHSYVDLHNKQYPGVGKIGLGELTTGWDDEVLSQMEDKSRRMLMGMNGSELANYKAMHPWYVREFLFTHASVAHDFQERVKNGEFSYKQAQKSYERFNLDLDRKFPVPTVTRQAEPWERAISVKGVFGDVYNIHTDRRQYVESDINSFLNSDLRAAKAKKGTQIMDEEDYKSSLIRNHLVPQLHVQGIDVKNLGYDASRKDWVQDLAVTLGGLHTDDATITYQDTLGARSEVTEDLLQTASISQTQRLAEATAEATSNRFAKRLTAVSPEILDKLAESGALTEQVAETAGRFKYSRTLGLDAITSAVRNLMERPLAKKALPAALALPLAYLAFQMVRGDDLNMGKQTQASVAGTSLDTWMQTPDMRMLMTPPPAAIQIPAPRPGHYRVSATDKKSKKTSPEEVSSVINQSLNSSMPMPVNLKTTVSDNTNNMSAEWWNRQILDAIF